MPRGSGRPAAFSFMLVLLLASWTGSAGARKLPVEKYPQAWSAMRSGAPGEVVGPEPIRKASALRKNLPPEARHGHLTLGPPLPSLFDRKKLETRPSLFRAGGPETTIVKVAVIRVEFQTDRAGDRTTGDGRFMEENPDPENIFIDPPPHDDRYFQAHLEAVDRYWKSMTYGCVRIEGDVFPRGQRFGAYMLSDMADYGPTSDDEFFSIEGLTRYSREALIAADADSDLVWSDYDVYFVVHAGSDWQNDILQNTPLDLPTFSIAFSDSELVVSDEGDTLRSMITYPETSSQDGFQVGLNGGIAHEMGHQLGLLDLYNVETFAPTVGFYDVMDSGNLTSVFVPRPGATEPFTDDDLVQVIGILPSAVGAWSRWFVTSHFGINPPVVKGDMARARLHAIQDQAPSLPGNQEKWYRLPISDTEYFMVENRVDDLDGRDANGNYDTALDQDDSTGVILGPIVNSTDEISNNYDLLLDPGVLIWHIDERQALANLSVGRGINVIFDDRSVSIEEADGIVDIGNPFSYFPLGTDKETFHAGNNANFTPDTRPNSDSNLGSPSNISIRNIGPLGQVIPMDFSFGAKPRGWPMQVGPRETSGLTSTTAADPDADGATEICVAGQGNAWEFEYEDRDGDGEVDPSGAWPQPATGSMLGTAEFTQALGDLDGDGRLEMIVATDSGGVYCWNADGTPYGAADSTGLLASFAPDERPCWSPVPADLDDDGTDELWLLTRDGRLHGWDVSSGTPQDLFTPGALLGAATDSLGEALISTEVFGDLNGDGVLDGLLGFATAGTLQIQRFGRDGRRVFRQTYPLPEGLQTKRVWMGLADLDRDVAANDQEIVLAVDGGWIGVLDSDGVLMPGWPVVIPGPIGGPPAFGDLDGDGLLEIVLASSGDGLVHAWNYNATEMPGWPVSPKLADFPDLYTVYSGAAIADVDGDGAQDVLVGFPDFTIRAFNAQGREVDGFPMVTGNPMRSTPCILDANSDGRLDLFAQCTDGNVYARILGGQPSATNPAWGMFAGGPRLHGSFPASRLPRTIDTGQVVLRGPVTVYPNPVRSRTDAITVRYTLGTELSGSTRVDIRLYNLAGEEVANLRGTTFPNTENVVTLPGDRLASGVYLCSVRARSGGHVESHVGKFAVIR